MSARLPITIVGGGLAGLALGLALRQRDVAVTLCEAGSYPRHRVCGEFICGQGFDLLAELGLREKFLAAGALEARNVSFHSGARTYPTRNLPYPALCLSRFVMDDLLAREFRAAGGLLRERERVKPAALGPGWVRATGRRIEADPSRVKWIGLKAHARNASLAADQEMHFVPDGYVGMCRLAGEEVNVCGLFAMRGPVPQLAVRWPEILRGPEGSVLRKRLQNAEFDPDSFCAVSGLDLTPASAEPFAECRIGDALTLIPPVTGNGMSMAFESARWAVEPLVAYSRGELAWDAARLAVARRCDAGFARRLRWASTLQNLLLLHPTRAILLAIAHRSEWLWRCFFAKTR